MRNTHLQPPRPPRFEPARHHERGAIAGEGFDLPRQRRGVRPEHCDCKRKVSVFRAMCMSKQSGVIGPPQCVRIWESPNTYRTPPHFRKSPR